jgi:putative flippase GtrA
MSGLSFSRTGNTAFFQLLRYGIVGTVVNMLGYGVYLLITFLGVPPKFTMSILYLVGVSAGYLCHGKWTFRIEKRTLTSFPRFVLAHLFGYLTNLLLLFYFVDIVGFPHQLVQLFAIFIVALQLFLTFKIYVFVNKK